VHPQGAPASGRRRAAGATIWSLGDLAVRVKQDVVHPVDYGVFDLQPEVRGVVRLSGEDFFVGEVGRRADSSYGFQDCLAAGEWLIAERAVHHHVLGEDSGKGVFVGAAVHAVDEEFHGVAVRGEGGHGYSLCASYLLCVRPGRCAHP
jgi:hypothetical protein